jgi:gluconolactonase
MEVVAEDLWFPEGPLVLPDGNLVVVEMRRQTLTHIRKDGVKTVIAKTGGGPNGAALGRDSQIYICNNGGLNWRTSGNKHLPAGNLSAKPNGRIERVSLDSGLLEVLYETDGVRKLRAPNDIVFDAFDGFWFTDFGRSRERDRDYGSVCYAMADGSKIREVLFPLIEPNGLGLSPDGGTLYVSETGTAKVWAWDVASPGEIVRSRSHSPYKDGRLVFSPPNLRSFDSMAVEAGGNICIGTLGLGGITVCTPQGLELDFLSVPDPLTTNICFGGGNMADAYITASLSGRLLRYKWPRSGLKLNN